MSKKIKWGVLGGANILKKVGPAIDGENSQFYAIASQNQNKREKLAKQYPDAILYDSYEALLQDQEIDAVYIPLPNGLHHKWVVEAARHKKHILCEKTIAVTTAELQEMTDVAEENGVILAEAYMLRYSKKFEKLAEILRSGIIGEVVNIQTSFYIPLANRNDIRYNRELGGGALFDLGCYCVNLILFVADILAGERTYPVEAQNLATFENGVDVNHVGMMMFANNRTATFACGFNDADIPHRDSTFAEIIGTHGSIKMGEFMFPGELSVRTPNKVETYFFEETSYYAREIDTISRAIRGEVDSLPMPIEESMRNLNLLQDLLNRRGYYKN